MAPTTSRRRLALVSLAAAVSSSLPSVHGLYADETGVSDFALRTAGHGRAGVRYARTLTPPGGAPPSSPSSSSLWITSESNAHPSAVQDDDGDLLRFSNGGDRGGDNDGPAALPLIGGMANGDEDLSRRCAVAARDVDSGEVLWRVDACASSAGPRVHPSHSSASSSFRPRHATLVLPPPPLPSEDGAVGSASVFTIDDGGIMRGWSGADGSLVWDVDVPADASQSSPSAGSNSAAPPAYEASTRILGARSGSTVVAGAVFSAAASSASSSDDEFLALYDGRTGRAVLAENEGGTLRLSAKSLLKRAKVGPPSRKLGFEGARIVDLVSLPSNPGSDLTTQPFRAALLVAWSGTSADVPGVRESTRTMAVSTFAAMAWMELECSHVEYHSSGAPAGVGDEDAGATGIAGGESRMVCRIVRAAPFKMDPKHSHVASTPLLLSTLRIAVAPPGASDLSPPLTALAVSATASQLLGIFGVRVGGGVAAAAVGHSWEIDALHPYWRIVESVRVVEDGETEIGGGGARAVRIAGVDDRYPVPRRFETLFLIDGDSPSLSSPDAAVAGDEDTSLLRRVHGPEKRDEEGFHDALIYCPAAGIVLSAEEGERIAAPAAPSGREASPGETVVAVHFVGRGGSDRKKSKGVAAWTTHASAGADGIPDGEPTAIVPASRGGTEGGLVTGAHTLECSVSDDGTAATATAVFTTSGGMTVAVRVETKTTIDGGNNEDDEGENSGEHEPALTLTKLWSSEESLGGISSAIFLDEMHADRLSAGADDAEDVALHSLEFSHRIRAQFASLQNFVAGGFLTSFLSAVLPSSSALGGQSSASPSSRQSEAKAERDVAFGFAKVSVMLSSSMHRIVALDTADRGNVLWASNLDPDARWHKLVHGGQFAGLADPRGNGGVHDHEMLALSYVPSGGEASTSTMEWKCFDGVTGRTFAGETIDVRSDVMQVVPLRAAHHHHAPGSGQEEQTEGRGCRQVAVLIHADDTATVVPDTPRARAAVDEIIAAGSAAAAGRSNGLFAHTVDGRTGEFRALRIVRASDEGEAPPPPYAFFRAVPVGVASFDPSRERIVNVAYPRRGEAIHSPSTILGDDALLLKYLNPHLVVVVTEATPAFLHEVASLSGGGGGASKNGFYNSLVGSDGESAGSYGGKGQRKPLGAGKSASADASSSAASAVVPSLFVSLVDSVSGQILHRVSHAHAEEADFFDHLPDGDGYAPSTPTRVPAVVSENWVVYAFFNRRTRRTDVGVLTLHEGMIDGRGITAFTAPEQELTFSSLESAKPIVLSKTYGLARAVTALGVTMTKGGISSKQFLFATENDQVVSMDRRMLDPRRPNGELKESEKMEGLIRYTPLLPIVSLRLPSHSHEVSSVRSISSASANLESQSLVLAFGGPDIFFARLAPSKGFDLLPDDFNRGLLTVVLTGLIVLLKWVQRMNSKKFVTTIWS